MTKSPTSKPMPKIGDTWLNEDFSGMAPEIQIKCHYDFYFDGDWTHAIRAAIIALENDLPFPDWAKGEAAAELRRSIRLEPLPKKRKLARSTPSRVYKDKMNQLSVIACVDAAEELGFDGRSKFTEAFKILNLENVPRSTVESVRKTYRTKGKKLREDSRYQTYKTVWRDALEENSEVE